MNEKIKEQTMFKEGTIWRIEHRYVLMWGGKPQPEQWLDSYYYCTGNFKEDSIEVLDVNRLWKDIREDCINLLERAKRGKHVVGNRCIYEITDSVSFIPLSKIRIVGNRCIYEITDSVSFIPLSKIRKLHKVAEIKIKEVFNEA